MDTFVGISLGKVSVDQLNLMFRHALKEQFVRYGLIPDLNTTLYHKR